MKNTHQRGDVGELRIANEASKRGYRVAFPYGHDHRYDLIVDRKGKLERVQVKVVRSFEDKVIAYTRSLGTKNGESNRKLYTHKEVDWIAIVDERTDRCYFVPIEVAENKDTVTLRLMPTKNKQQKGIWFAKDFEAW